MQQAQTYAGGQRGEVVLPLCDGQRLALCVLRRAGGGQRGCALAVGEARGLVGELSDATAALAELLQPPCAPGCIRAVQLEAPGSGTITKDERRLLNVIAAAQAGDDGLADNYLYRLALERGARARLATAAARLGACLAVYGYWLPSPATTMPMPAAALCVARRQGVDVHDMTIAWP
jgi:hypothetical protein